MGKRELVLIALFIVAGAVVYQVTAPPAPPGSDLSVGGIFQRMRRGVRGARETAVVDSTQTAAVADGIRLFRINLPRASDVTITGSDRRDIEVQVKTTARGYDQAEAKAAAEAAKITLEAAGDAMVLSGAWDDHRGPSGFVTQIALVVLVPAGLRVSMQPHVGLLSTANLAGFECISSRGETHVVNTAGDVVVGHTGGTLEVSGGINLKLTSRNSRGEVSKFSGQSRIDATSGRLTITDLTGTLDIEARNADLSLDRIAGLKAPMRYNGTGGELRIEGLRTEARIDGRNTTIDVRMAAAAPVTIYNLGAISVTAPATGYTLDAATNEGRISVEESGITPSEGPDAKAAGKVRGGGPPLVLRATRGRIEVRR
jgi:Toastrack DUF4097